MKAKVMILGATSAILAASLYSQPENKPTPLLQFAGLGDLAGGFVLSVASGISGDGKVIIGYSHSEQGIEAFRWTENEGMTGLGFPFASATSDDGRVVVGSRLANGRSQPVRWTEGGGTVAFLAQDEYRHGAAHGVSADGSMAAGVVGTDSSERQGSQVAWIWTRNGKVAPLATIDDEPLSGEARAISAHGKVVVGTRQLVTGHPQAFRWSADTGVVGLGVLPGHTTSSAYAVSADGAVVVGCSSDYITHSAFRWTEETGMVELGGMGERNFGSTAFAVSADGSVIVGSNSSHLGQVAVVWDADLRIHCVRDLLPNLSSSDPSVCRWQLNMATAVSADGTVVAGVGTNPLGKREAWIARLAAAPLRTSRDAQLAVHGAQQAAHR